MRLCGLCQNKFKDYQAKNRNRCGSCNTKIRRFRAKAAAIKLLGGACSACGWHGNQAALQFHHKSKNAKEFTIGNVANKNWETIKKEIKKCLLLCANCHAIEHSTKNEKLFLREARNYKGRMLNF
jgi:predicted HNH restriction endonuclease